MPLKCPTCFALHAPAPSCPACGVVYTAKNKVGHLTGELVALAKGSPVSRSDKQQAWGELRAIASERGYKDGWTAHQFKARFGLWPRGLRDVELPPTLAMRNFVRSRQIAYSRGVRT